MPPKKRAAGTAAGAGRGSAPTIYTSQPQQSYYQHTVTASAPGGSKGIPLHYTGAGRGVPAGRGKAPTSAPSSGYLYSTHPSSSPMSSPPTSMGRGTVPVSSIPAHSSLNPSSSLPQGVIMRAITMDFEQQLAQHTKSGQPGKLGAKGLKKDDVADGRASPTPSQAAALGFLIVPRHKRSYQAEIQKVMMTNGVSKESQGCAEMLEDTARQYVLDVLKNATFLTLERGSKLSVEDIMFQIRKDTDRLSRLQRILAVKEALKAKQKDEDTEDIDEETKKEARAKRIKLNWETQYGLSDEEDDPDVMLTDEEDNMVLSKKLDSKNKKDDDELKEFSDLRPAIFTFKKLKKFKEWIDVVALDIKVNDDVIEALGILASECVVQVIQGSLRVKAEMEGRPVNTTSVPQASPTIKKGVRGGALQSPPARGIGKKMSETLQPTHILEYIRRAKQPLNPVTGFCQARRRYGSRILSV